MLAVFDVSVTYEYFITCFRSTTHYLPSVLCSAARLIGGIPNCGHISNYMRLICIGCPCKDTCIEFQILKVLFVTSLPVVLHPTL